MHFSHLPLPLLLLFRRHSVDQYRGRVCCHIPLLQGHSSIVPRPDHSCSLAEDAVCAQGGRLHVMPAVKDAHTLCVTFQLPSLLKAYRKKADEYLSHLIGHEGRGSLFSLLKVAICAAYR